MDDARETRIERHLRAAVMAAADAGRFEEAIRISAEADVPVAITPISETAERVEILFDAPVHFERATPQWVPPTFVGAWEGPETDLSERVKEIVRGQDGTETSAA
jgi:hypothetical protein